MRKFIGANDSKLLLGYFTFVIVIYQVTNFHDRIIYLRQIVMGKILIKNIKQLVGVDESGSTKKSGA